MRSVINKLWYGNVIPQEDGLTHSNEMKECLLGYMSHYHEDLEKSFNLLSLSLTVRVIIVKRYFLLQRVSKNRQVKISLTLFSAYIRTFSYTTL